MHEGKVRYLGHSNFSGWQIAHAEWTARTRGFERFVSAQNEYSLLERGSRRDLVPALQEYGIGLLPFFPLAQRPADRQVPRGEEPPEGSRLQRWGMQAQRRATWTGSSG